MRGESWQPAVDVFETEDSIVLRLELPGVISRDVRVNTDGSRVRVSGTRRIPGTGDVTRLHQMEIAFGPECNLHLMQARYIPGSGNTPRT